MSNNQLEFVAALYPSYQQAQQAVQRLYASGHTNVTVTYVDAKFDETNDGEGGFYPDHTPDVQIPIESAAPDIAEQEVPQLMSLSGPSASRTSPSLHQRLDMIGIPKSYTQSYINSLVGGQTLAIVRGHENVTDVMRVLTDSAVSVHNFPSEEA